jgi:hypothetical protein
LKRCRNKEPLPALREKFTEGNPNEIARFNSTVDVYKDLLKFKGRDGDRVKNYLGSGDEIKKGILTGSLFEISFCSLISDCLHVFRWMTSGLKPSSCE